LPGANVSAITRSHGLDPSQFFVWRRKALASGLVARASGGGRAIKFARFEAVAGEMVEIVVSDVVVRVGGEVEAERLDAVIPHLAARCTADARILKFTAIVKMLARTLYGTRSEHLRSNRPSGELIAFVFDEIATGVAAARGRAGESCWDRPDEARSAATQGVRHASGAQDTHSSFSAYTSKP
jgi:transposase-like protein